MKVKALTRITIVLILFVAVCTIGSMAQSVYYENRVLTAVPLHMVLLIEAGIGLFLCLFIALLGWFLKKQCNHKEI